MKRLTAYVLVAVGFLLLSAGFAQAAPNGRVLQALDAQVPFVDPELAPEAVRLDGLSLVAVTITRGQQKQLFAADLERRGILPVLISGVNTGRHKVLVHGRGVKIWQSGGTLEPLALEAVMAVIQGKNGFRAEEILNVISLGAGSGDLSNLKQQRDEAIRTGLLNKSLTETVLFPGQSFSGFVFFDKLSLGEPPYDVILDVQSLNLVEYQQAILRLGGF